MNRRLHQRRVRDRPRREPGVVVRRGAGDPDGDELGRALAAAHDFARKVLRPPREVPPAAPGRRLASIVTPDAPDASRNTQSLVEHSPSTVIALNVSSATLRSARCSTAGATCASVVRNPSIVAMRGSIMPEPLAMPPTANVRPSAVVTDTALPFGNGSVVMMARMAASLPVALSAADGVGDARANLVDAERHADHARGGHEYLMRRAARGRGGRFGHLTRDRQAGLARTGVRAAGVDDDRGGAAAGCGQVLARHHDRRRHRLVRREHGRGGYRRRPPRSARDPAAPVAAAGLRFLMPHATPAARKPCGAVMPPVDVPNHGRSCDGEPADRAPARRTARRRAATSTIAYCLHERNSGQRDAVGGDLFRQPEMRHDGEVLAHEEPRVVRERAQHLETGGGARGGGARRRAARPGRRGGTPRRRPANGLPRRARTAAPARRTPSSRPPTSHTTNRCACRRSSSSSRGSRWPSSACEVISCVQRLRVVSVPVLIERSVNVCFLQSSRFEVTFRRRRSRRRASRALRRCPASSRCTAATAG